MSEPADAASTARRGVVATPGRALAALRAALERDAVLGYLLLAPGLAVLLVFVAYPFVYGVWLSLSDLRIGQEGAFIGLRNFANLFQDSTYRTTVRNTFEYTIVTCIFKFIFGLGMAVVLNQKYPLKRFVRAAVLLPWIIPTVFGALAWRWIFDPNFSVINWVLLRLFHVAGPQWLGAGFWPMLSLMVVNIWRGTPFFGISFLAGMQTIPEELYDAATIDGADGWKKFWAITFPLLTPVTTVVTLLSVILTFGDFQLIYVLTGGGPANATNVFGTLAYYLGINAGRLGYGAAISLTMFPVLAVVILATLVALRRE
ncbi:MAG: sugar ABC transporter permease [Chloroflexi bacterium]|nr:sugar ABC transporter permease [Chloroflexota bacterium]